MAVNKTLAELNEAIKTEMQLDPGLISDDERKRFINEAIVDLGSLGCFEKEIDLKFINGQAELPEDYVEYLGLYRDGKIIPPASTDSAVKGVLLGYPVLTLKPATDETLRLWYAYAPVKLNDLTDRPDIPYGYDRALIDFSVGLAHRKNGNIGLYREYMSSYEDLKNTLYLRLNTLQNARVNREFDKTSADDEVGIFSNSEILF